MEYVRVIKGSEDALNNIEYACIYLNKQSFENA